jgi:hypothetical protein
VGDSISRKDFCRNAGRYVAGAAAGVTGLHLFSSGGSLAKTEAKSLPWPYVALEPELVRKKAHDYFWQGGCCFAGFAGILKELQQKVGEPFTAIPAELMSFGGGGVKGWGTLCGALNGAFAAINLVCDGRTSGLIIDELMGWYTQEPLPSEMSNEYAKTKAYQVDKGIGSLPQSVSGSPLCHISTTRWSVNAGYPADSVARYERCARLTGDVVAKAVILLNDHGADRFKKAFAPLQSTSDCLGCHGPKQDVNNVSAKLRCVQCHDDPHK